MLRVRIIWVVLALLVLLALHRPAHAATLCRGIGFDGDIQLPEKPGPLQYGSLWDSATFPTIRLTPGYGGVAWWYTSDGFDWQLNWAFCTSGKCVDPVLVKDLSEALASSDRLAAINAVAAKHYSLPANSSALLTWCPHWAEIKASKPPPVPYVVAKNGAYTTRPAYAIVPATATEPASRGARSTSFRAEVGATCDCRVRVIEGKTALCAANQERTLVAVCAKV